VTSADLLVDGFGRIRQNVHHVVEGLPQEHLAFQIDDAANSIAWLVWHLARVQDDHVADAADLEQVWLRDGWVGRFALPLDPKAIGYGHTSEEVAAVHVEDPALLIDYYEAVHRQTVGYLRNLRDEDFDRIVDRSWNPAVSLGVRLISVVGDTMMHVGQAQYVRGILDRRG
jgi:uncharacterized protein DUF664